MENHTTISSILNSSLVPPPHGNHTMTEGGFLSGRNPFVFVATSPLPTFIVQLVVIVAMSRFVKLFLTPIKQPAVIAETISGIILGPTVMGHIPYFTETIFSKPSLPFLNLMSNFGLVLFLFLVGVELDPRMLRKSISNSLAISLAGMALPFGLGVGTSYILFTYIEPPSHQEQGFTRYLLFLGVAMAITAFPVLARILTELNLLKTKVGSITISAAAVDDATSWCLLALVISLINAGSGLIALYVFLMGLGYSTFLIFVVRPIFVRVLRRSGAFEHPPSQVVMFFTLMLVFISAFITDAIGIHAIFGGFLAGLIIPHQGGFAYHITEKLEDIVSVVFLPLYFALSGLRTSIGSLNDSISWAIVVLVITVACFGKIFGCTLAAKASKMGWRESLTIGCLMNCKGLVELIVLNLGYDAHVISQRTFAIMVIMALVTTFITVPLVSFIYPPIYHDKPEDLEAACQKKKKHAPPSLLVSVNRIEQVPQILNIIHLLQSKLNVIPPKEPRRVSDTSQISIPSIISTHCLRPQRDSDKPHKTSVGVVINALRLIQLTERDSSVMLQTSQDALRDDPVTKMLRTFCDINKHRGHVRSLVKVVTMDKFGETLVKTAEEVNAKYVLVPWNGNGSIVEDTAINPVHEAFSERRRRSIFTSSNHISFMSDLLSKATCTVLMLVERGLETISSNKRLSNAESPIQSYQQIYVPYFGGPDDREVLEIVIGLSRIAEVRINLIRYKTLSSRRHSGDSGACSAESEEAIVHPEVVSEVDYQDDDLFQQLFGSTNTLLANILYSEVESYSPLSTALHYLDHLSSSDLVIVGKNSVTSNMLKNPDPERRKILGDLAESILLWQCNSSLLVVQASR